MAESSRPFQQRFSRSIAEWDLSSRIAMSLTLLAIHSELVDAPDLPEPVCEDPDDDKFLACALAAGVEVVVSGDRHLLRVSGWSGIEVLTPRQFVERYLDR